MSYRESDSDSSANKAVITAEIDAWLLDAPDEPVDCTMIYRPGDPYAVTAYFTTREGGAPWTFARDLLRDGVVDGAGDANVRVAPLGEVRRLRDGMSESDPEGQTSDDSDCTLLQLRAPIGVARLACNRTQLNWFLDQAYALIPEGDESMYLDMDALVERLMS